MIEERRKFTTKDLISPFTLFESVKSKFGRNYNYERSGQQTLLLKGSKNEPLWTLYVEDDTVTAISINPALMSDDDADEFYNVIHDLIQ